MQMDTLQKVEGWDETNEVALRRRVAVSKLALPTGQEERWTFNAGGRIPLVQAGGRWVDS